MKSYFNILFVLMLIQNLNAQPLRYTTKVFGQVDTLKAVEYAIAPWLNKPVAFLADYNVHEGETTTEERPLLMDIYQPRGDSVSQRPTIVFVHGGAFLLGTRLNDDMVALCDSFARRGYVTVSIDYRLGIGSVVTRLFGIIIQVSVPETNVRRAVYRGVQDGRAAVRFLKQNAELYGIDTTKIYMAGSSAGAFVALHNIYYNETGEIPSEVFTDPSLGGLDAIGVNGFGGVSNAVVSYWGAVEKTTVINGESQPVFLVHGVADKIVPFKNGIPLESSIPANPLISVSMPETFGSYCIDSALANQNIFHETYFVEGKGHEFYGCDTGEFPEEGPNQYWDTIIGKTSEFLFDIFKPTVGFDVSVMGTTAWFTNLSSSGSGVEWDFGDGAKSSEPNPVHRFPNTGKYIVSLKICHPNLACDTLSKTIDVVNTGIAERLDEVQVIFPNPTSGLIFIEGLGTSPDVAVFNLTGTKLLEFSRIENKKIDVSSLHPGAYILEINSAGKKVVRKFVKNN